MLLYVHIYIYTYMYIYIYIFVWVAGASPDRLADRRFVSRQYNTVI